MWTHLCVGLCSPSRQSLIRKRVPQVFDEARPLVVSGANDRGLEPDPDEPTGDEVEFPPPRPADLDRLSMHCVQYSLSDVAYCYT